MCVKNDDPFWDVGEHIESLNKYSNFPFAEETEATQYLIKMTRNPKFKILTGEKAKEMYRQKLDAFWGSSSKTATKKKNTTPKTGTKKTTTATKTTTKKTTTRSAGTGKKIAVGPKRLHTKEAFELFTKNRKSKAGTEVLSGSKAGLMRYHIEKRGDYSKIHADTGL